MQPTKEKTVIITGSASGIGASLRHVLELDGANVIGIDLKDADVIADLSHSDGRKRAISETLDRAGGVIDGVVTSAGVGPPCDPKKMISINWLGTVELLNGLREALVSSRNTARVVAVSSNSTTITPNVPEELIAACLDFDQEKSYAILEDYSGMVAMAIAYAASKTAVARFVRRTAPTAEWAGSGIRLNAIAPGAILTPLLQGGLDDEEFGDAIRTLPVPVGEFGSPEVIARWIEMMLSDAADFMCGSLIVVDGGSDALIRPDDWPKSFTI
ncbi:MAG: SDR family oxidoreductase [Actinomycetota bacterium]|nr:SDR family oxidoreductase [Actinomycetota bacterium]